MNDAKVAIVGSREFNDRNYMFTILNLYKEKYGISIIVSGGARGADTLAEEYAKLNEIDFHVFVAKWKAEGNKAGPRRNLRIANYADVMLAFPLGESKGTYNAVSLMKKLGKPVQIFIRGD